MRTTIELPDPLYRQVKAKAALEGVPMKTLVQRLVEHGLATMATPQPAASGSAPPTLSIGQRLPDKLMSNAALFELAEGEGSRHGPVLQPPAATRVTCRTSTSGWP